MQEKRTHTRVPAKAIHETSVCLRRSGQKMQKGRKRQKREKGEKRQKRREMLRFRLAKPFPFRYTIRIV